MKDVANITIIVIILVIFVGCAEQSKEVETNKILRTLIEEQQDSLNIYFEPIDSAGTKKFKKHISYTDEPDSIVLYYKSVDTLKFEKPLTVEFLNQYGFTYGNDIDTLFTKEEVGQWNEDISNYKSKKWSRQESRSLPIIAKSHHEIEEFYTQQEKLESFFYYSTPFFNKEGDKALIYQNKISKSSKIRQLYILSNKGDTWSPIYRVTLYISTS
ncbi:hypothetical protein LQ318_07845 [Aliifodinibius salicampi]|uniref:Lipoprotein n=2 Tax=Fodinibius salicampi TaxID=1920655 RepID=A0ABT3PY93_9BACT|nr:hypothetical protein [Fodinibius salicampi]